MGEPSDCALDIPAGTLANANQESDPRDEKVTTDTIVAALRSVYDPEIPVNVYDLGLIYRIEIGAEGAVEIDMTLTAPACPVAGEIMNWVRNAVEGVDGIGVVKVNLVFDPPWDQSKMAEDAKLELGFI
jgi:FeS assembly SUF system protein